MDVSAISSAVGFARSSFAVSGFGVAPVAGVGETAGAGVGVAVGVAVGCPS